MISIAIPTYNRSGLVLDAFSQVLDNDLISEIIIVDDCSESDHVIWLSKSIHDLHNKKITKLHHNGKNLGPFRNKYEAVKKCSNEWVILLDSDNIINNQYIDIIKKEEWYPDTIYCPEFLKYSPGGTSFFEFSDFKNIVISKENIKEMFTNRFFSTLLNAGNYFVNRNSYIATIDNNIIEDHLTMTDVHYYSYLWLSSGNKIKVVPELWYVHRQHPGSWWFTHQNESIVCSQKIDEKLSAL